jgi:hypothetical protein
MSHADHEWAREQVAAKLAGGLAAEERARFEAHVHGCAECIAEVDASRRFEQTIDNLFAPVRPKAGLEERVIRAIRRAPAPETLPVWRRALLGVAAAGMFGLTGYWFLEGGSLSGSPPDVAARPMGPADPQPALAPTSELKNYWAKLDGGEGRAREEERLHRGPGREGKLTGGAGYELEKDLDGRKTVDAWAYGDTGGTPVFRAGADVRGLLSAEELAKSRANDGDKEIASANALFERLRRDSDHNETADEENFQKVAKGDSLDFVSDKPFKGKGTYDTIGGLAGAGGKFASRGERSEGAPMPPPPPALPEPASGPSPAAEPKPDPAKPESRALALADDKDAGKDLYFTFKQEAAGKKEGGAYFRPAEQGQSTVLEVAKEKAPLPPVPPKPQPSPKPEAPKPADPQAAPQETPKPPPVQQRKVIRSGEVEFEIEGFDSTVAKITAITAEEGGFIATVNSEKLENGKVRGSVVVRVPPDRLDTLLLKLRALGELKSQRIGSQDVTKAYYDLESRLRAALAMEERLIRIIKDGTGAIKDLLAAEKELGEWRTRIEQYKGEQRYYDAQVALSTLTLTLWEKEIRAAFGVVRTERVDMGVEVEDVEKAHREALLAVADAKGRVTRSELKQHAAGQFNAILQFEVAPTASGPLRDRLKQLGTLSRFDLNVVESTEGGTAMPKADGLRVTQKDSVFAVSLYNLANVAPRETTHLNLACLDAEGAYKIVLARIEKAGGRVVSSNLNRQKNDQTTATISFEVKTPEADAVLADVRATGEVMRLTAQENPDVQNTTKSKRGFLVQLYALGAVAPRETTTLRVASKEVAAAYRAVLEAARKAEGRIIVAQLNEGDRRNLNARLDFDVRREHEAAVDLALRSAGETLSRTSNRVEDGENVIDSKVRFTLSIQDLANLAARETTKLSVAAKDVGKAHRDLLEAVRKAEAWIHGSQLNENDRQNVTASLTFDVRREQEAAALSALQAAGVTYTRSSQRAAEGSGAAESKVRFEVTLFDQARIPARETHLVAVEVGHVKAAFEAVESMAAALKGRVVDSTHTRERSGRHVSRAILEVPLAAARSAVEKLTDLGQVKLLEARRNPQVPEAEISIARLDVTLSNEVIVGTDDGPWANIKKGLSVSLTAGSYALMLVMIGVCFILPLGLVLWGGLRAWKRLRPRPTPAS